MKFYFIVIIFFRTGGQRTDAVEFWRLVGDIGVYQRRQRKEKNKGFCGDRGVGF